MRRRRARRLVIVGAGGHAKVVVDILLAQDGWDIVGLTDADPSPRKIYGLPVLGRDEDVLPNLRRQGVEAAFVALGDNVLRLRIAARLRALGFDLPNAISPRAFVSPNATLGVGIAVMPQAAINAAATIGDFAIINTAASIDHDCVVGEGAHIGPGAVLAGWVRVGARVFVGVGAAAVPGVEIGADAVIGAGAAVIRRVPAGATSIGVPARIRRTRDARTVRSRKS